MEDQLISFETAKLTSIHCLHSYDIECKHYYTSDGELGELYWDEDWCDLSRRTEDYIKAPTQSLLQRWLREVHNIPIYALLSTNNDWYYQISLFNDDNCITQFDLDKKYTYEQALELGLQESLKLIK